MDKATPEDTLATHIMLDPGVQAKLVELLLDALTRGSAIRDDGTEDSKVVAKLIEVLEHNIEKHHVDRVMRMRISQQQNMFPPSHYWQPAGTAIEDQRSWIEKAIGLK